MFYVYSKLQNGQYKIYDDKDLTLDICTVDEIRQYLRTGIKIKGVSKTGTSLKIAIQKIRKTHMISCRDLDKSILDRDENIKRIISLKDCKYLIINNGKCIGVLGNITISKGTENSIQVSKIKLVGKNKGVASSIIEYLHSHFNCDNIFSTVSFLDVDAFDKAGADFGFSDLDDYRDATNGGIHTFKSSRLATNSKEAV